MRSTLKAFMRCFSVKILFDSRVDVVGNTLIYNYSGYSIAFIKQRENCSNPRSDH